MDAESLARNQAAAKYGARHLSSEIVKEETARVQYGAWHRASAIVDERTNAWRNVPGTVCAS
jgi:DNA integrity scanning protein DisA with diadenylate cyclase activity